MLRSTLLPKLSHTCKMKTLLAAQAMQAASLWAIATACACAVNTQMVCMVGLIVCGAGCRLGNGRGVLLDAGEGAWGALVRMYGYKLHCMRYTHLLSLCYQFS